MLIIKKILFASLVSIIFICPLASASIANSSANQKEQDKARQSTLSPEEQTYSSSQEPSKAKNIEFPKELICRNIKNIVIESDNEELANKLLGKITQQAINKCLGIEGIRLLSRTLQNELVVQGYITSLIDIPPQSLNSGDLQLTLVWGKVGKIAFASDSLNPTSIWNSLPLNSGETLRLADLEQGISNLQRLPGSAAHMKLQPGEHHGETDILLTRTQDKKWQVGAWLDDSGSRTSGRYQGGGALYLYDITRLNDMFYISTGGDVEFNQRKDGNKNSSVYYSLPFGYWALSLYGAYSEYRQLFKGSWTTAEYKSKNRYYSASLSRMLSHTREQKTTLSAQIFKGSSRYFLGGSEVEVMRKQNPAWELSLNHQRYFDQKVMDASLSFQRRLPWISSMPTPEQQAGLFSKHSRVIQANLQALMKFRLTGDKFSYAPKLNAQFSPDKLSSDNKYNIGSRWTVRGFDGERTLSGQQGWYWRNDFIWDIPGPVQQVYFGIDIGKIIGDSGYYSGKILSGAVAGLRGEKFNTQYDLFVATPIAKPNNFHSDALNLGMSLKWRF